MEDLEYHPLIALLLSPILVICQIITIMAVIGLICLGSTIWVPLAASATGEWTLLDAGLCYLVIIASAFVTNWLHENCDEETVFKIGAGFWAAFFLIACLVSGISRSLGL